MYIKNMSIKNFKSIEEAEIEFNPLTMIVGANASGKSNIILPDRTYNWHSERIPDLFSNS